MQKVMVLALGLMAASGSTLPTPKASHAEPSREWRSHHGDDGIYLYVMDPFSESRSTIDPRKVDRASSFRIHVTDPEAERALLRVTATTRDSKERRCLHTDFRMRIDVPSPSHKGFRRWAVSTGGYVFSIEDGNCGRISQADVKRLESVLQLRDLVQRPSHR